MCGDVAGGNAVARDFGPWHGSAGADREQFLPKEREGIGDCLSEESATGKSGVREINAALILGCALSGIYNPDRRLGKVEDEKTSENLLKDEVRLLRMKMDEANGVFQAAEGSLDSPTHGIETLKKGRQNRCFWALYHRRSSGAGRGNRRPEPFFSRWARLLQSSYPRSAKRMTGPETAERSTMAHKAAFSSFSCSFWTITSV